MQTIPIKPVASQSVTPTLAGQACQINLYQKSTGLYFDLLIANASVVRGVICENLNLLLRSKYLGVIGDFCFYDSEGDTDPYYTGLGSRYSLVYLEAANLPTSDGVV